MNFLQLVWDAFIYRRAYGAFRRLAARNYGSIVVFQIWLNDYLKQHPIGEEQANLAAIYAEQHFKIKSP